MKRIFNEFRSIDTFDSQRTVQCVRLLSTGKNRKREVYVSIKLFANKREYAR